MTNGLALLPVGQFVSSVQLRRSLRAYTLCSLCAIVQFFSLKQSENDSGQCVSR